MKQGGFILTAAHLLGSLSDDLYEDPAACLWEIVRNGAVACMPDGWDSTQAKIEISFMASHPLKDKERAMVILDYGSGITPIDLTRMRHLGATMNDLHKGGSHHGAAQKRIGRFAALAMNKLACENKDPRQGFYYITRSNGKSVMMVEFIPAQIEEEQDLRTSQISLQHPSLDFLRGIEGSFTACIIPNPVFSTLEEIREALRWRLPRRHDLPMSIRVGKQLLAAPDLVGRLVESTAEGDINVYIDRLDEATRLTRGPGIHLCDQETGLPVTTAMKLGKNIPGPLWHPELTGDIFIPGLLANQDTSRRGLRSQFMKNARWQRVQGFLIGQVCERARALLGDRYDFGSSDLDKSLRSLAEQCAAIWGEPELSPAELPFDNVNGKSEKSTTTSIDSKTPKPTRIGTATPKPRRPQTLPIRIGDQTFWLVKMSMSPDQFAQVNEESPNIIHINERDYEGMPSAAAAQVEHILLRLVEAVAVYNNYESPQATTEIGHRILEFRSKTKGKKKK